MICTRSHSMYNFIQHSLVENWELYPFYMIYFIVSTRCSTARYDLAVLAVCASCLLWSRQFDTIKASLSVVLFITICCPPDSRRQGKYKHQPWRAAPACPAALHALWLQATELPRCRDLRSCFKPVYASQQMRDWISIMYPRVCGIWMDWILIGINSLF